MPAKVLYDLHKPGRPTKCFYLRIQKAEPGIPSCWLEAIRRSAVTFLLVHLSVGRSWHSVLVACRAKPCCSPTKVFRFNLFG